MPGSLEWSITEEPKPEHMATTKGSREFALARLLVYEDANANAKRDAGEKVVAQASVVALYFSSMDHPAEDSPTGVTIPKGIHFLGLPPTCALGS